LPNRADRVDDVSRCKAVSPSELCLPSLASAQQAALVDKVGACGTVDCSIDASATKQRRVRGIDDRIDRKRCDVGLEGADQH
jgi:hypothetical protein